MQVGWVKIGDFRQIAGYIPKTVRDRRMVHGPRGSASPVLTATGFVNGRWQISTPTESTPLDRSPKNLVQVITSAAPTAVPNLVQIRPRGLLGKWVKYNEFFYLLIGLYLISRTHLQVRPIDGFSRLMAQTTRTPRKDVSFGGFVDIAPYFGGEIPRKPQFLGREYAFLSHTGKILKVSCYRNYCINFN